MRRVPRWFSIGMVVLVVGGFAVRALNVLVWHPTCQTDLIASAETGVPYPECEDVVEYRLWGDAAYGYGQAYLLAQGHGFSDTATWFLSGGDRIVDSAGDPPLFAMVLAVPHLLGVHEVALHRLLTAVIGTIGVGLLGLVGARVAGHRAGLVAAGFAALSPQLWINDGMLLSESLYVPMLAGTLLAAYRFWDRRRIVDAAVLGVLTGLTALTRGESVVLFGVLVLPLAWGMRALGWRRLLGLVATTWAVGLAVLVPWVGYNLSRFEAPVLMTSQTGAVLAAGACEVTFYGDSLGYYGADCYREYVREGYAIGHPRLPGCDEEAVAALDALDEAERTRAEACWPDPMLLDEAERDQVIGELAGAWIADNRDRLPVVMVARVARILELYNPELGSEAEPLGQNVRLNWAVEGRGRWQSRAGFVVYWLLLAPAIAGAVVLWRRRVPISPLVAMPVVIVVTAAFAFGVTRYRVPLDVSMAVLAAVAVDAWCARRWPAPDGGTVRLRGPGGQVTGSLDAGSGAVRVSTDA